MGFGFRLKKRSRGSPASSYAGKPPAFFGENKVADPSPSPRTNELGQPIGAALDGWRPPPHPPRVTLQGRFCDVEPIDPDRHAAELHAANSLSPDDRLWTYLVCGPFESFDAYRTWMLEACLGDDPQFYAIVERSSGDAIGVSSYMRIAPSAGAIEVGNLCFSPRLSQTPAATEAMYLMMRNAFELGYRRYEWKCDSLNIPSRRAAERLGFIYEGLFRQAIVYKGRNRDTAWYAIIDQDWPKLADAFEQWLSSANFDESGAQRRSLADLRAGG